MTHSLVKHAAIRPGAVAVITGAAAGIGYAIAHRMLLEGMNVVLADKDSARLEQVSREFKSLRPNATVVCIVGDISNPALLEEIRNQAFALGEVSILVNNAAFLDGAGPWEESPRWRRIMEVNFWSALTLQQLFVEDMIAQNTAAAIINLGSKEGITTPPGNAAYAVSKSAIKVLTEQLSHELRERCGNQITAHLLIPGFTFTPMNFPDMQANTARAATAWTADQVVDRMVTGMGAGDFYIFCEDNEVTRGLDQRRMQWAADDMILNRPALSRWHPDYKEQYANFIADLSNEH